jgi:hypothetical protein
MPKTAMNKDHLPSTWEDYVGISRNFLAVQPETVSKAVEEGSYGHLGFCIFGFHRPHRLRAA